MIFCDELFNNRLHLNTWEKSWLTGQRKIVLRPDLPKSGEALRRINAHIVVRHLTAVVLVKRHIEISSVKQIFVARDSSLPVAGRSAYQSPGDER
jgi:hypothetical protein